MNRVTNTAEHGRLTAWLRNVGLGYADLAVGATVYVVLTPILVRHLGAEAYAVWIISHTITFYLGFLDLGMTQAQIRIHARFAARGHAGKVARLLATSVAYLLMAGVIAALIALALASFAPMQLLEIPPSLGADFRIIIAILGMNLLVAFPGSALTSAYEGAQRFDLAAWRSIGVRLLTAAVQLWALSRGYGLLALATIELLASVLRLLIDLCTLSRLAPGALREPVRRDRRIWRRMRTFALWSSVDDLVVEGTSHLDQILIAAMLPLALLTPYALCMSAGAVLMIAVEPVVETFFPMAAGLHAQGRRPELHGLLLTGTKVAVAIAAPLAIFLGIFGEAALTLWVPQIRDDLPAGLLPLIVANMMVSVFMWSPNMVLMALNRVRAVAILTLLEVLLAFALIIALVPALGLNGIAAGALIANVVAALLLQLPLVRSTVGVAISTLVFSTLGRVLLAAAPAALIAYWLARQNDNPGWLQLAIAMLVIGTSYAIGLLVVGLTREERSKYLHHVLMLVRAQPSRP